MCAGEFGSASIFSSATQLTLLSTAKTIFFDATFKVVPILFYQLFTVFVPDAGYVFPVLFALMSRKTTQLYTAVFAKIRELVPLFHPERVMADYEEASVSGFKNVYGNEFQVGGCWFHFSQAIMKKSKKLGLTPHWNNHASVKKCIRCVMCLPLLPSASIAEALVEVQQSLVTSCPDDAQQSLLALCQYVNRHWINKSTIGVDRITVQGHPERTNNGVESFHATLGRKIKVTHPNLFVFLGHLQEVAVDATTDVQRLRNGRRIRRSKKKEYVLNDVRIKSLMQRFATGNTTTLEFLAASAHCVENAELQLVSRDSDDELDYDRNAGEQVVQVDVEQDEIAVNVEPANLCQVCLGQPVDKLALVPCGHATFCSTCIRELERQGLHCPLCRSQIQMVITLFQ